MRLVLVIERWATVEADGRRTSCIPALIEELSK